MGAGHTVVTSQALRRWALVLGLVLVLAAVPVAISRWPARAGTVGAATLRARIAASAALPHHGYAQSSGLLGLPALPNLTQVTALASGTTEMRSWYAGPDRWRLDVLGEGTERDLYQVPGAQVIWDYGDNRLIRVEGDQPVRLPRAADLTPPELVRRVLATAGGDRVDAIGAKRVAGIDAAGLRLVPASPDTTVAHVDIWADPERGLPVQAEITAKGGTRPVFVTRFLELHFETPDAATLAPPAPRADIGYTVTGAPDILGAISRRRPVALPGTLGGLTRRGEVAGAAGVYGAGLSSIVVAALPGRVGGPAFRQVTTYGQRIGDDASVIATGLLSVLVVRGDSRTFLVAGLVGPALMRRVAAGLAEVTA